MAKAKKQEKPIEQRLEEALVLYEKTPYELPSNWCWTRWDYIANLYTGNSINEREKELKYTGLLNGYNYIATKDIGFDYKIEYENGIKIPREENRFKKARKGSTLLCIEGGSAGRKLGFLEEDVCFVNKLCCFDFNGVIDKFYYYYLQTNAFFNEFTASKVGLIGGVSVNNLKQLMAPIAPLEEQKRIVEIIEKQFAKIDEARDLIQKSLDSFADRKSAILHKAFTGELTKKWREHINQCLNLTQCTLQDVCLSVFDGDHMPPPQTSSGIPFLVIGNVNKGVLSFENTRYVSKEYYASLTQSRKPELGDVLYTLVGSYGIAVLVDQTRDFCFQRHMALLKVDRNKILSKFLWYMLQSQEVYNQATNIATGTAQLTVPIKGLRKVVINVPSLEEQEEIVRILDSIFEKEDKSKELIDMLDKIDEMKKSILARAFRGELGTSNPTDEPATDLLRKILGKKEE